MGYKKAVKLSSVPRTTLRRFVKDSEKSTDLVVNKPQDADFLVESQVPDGQTSSYDTADNQESTVDNGQVTNVPQPANLRITTGYTENSQHSISSTNIKK
ncbi:hypothetical protein Trydic_g18715 [Trypoxylus dichotomus]